MRQWQHVSSSRLHSEAMCQQFVEQHKEYDLQYSGYSVFCNVFDSPSFTVHARWDIVLLSVAILAQEPFPVRACTVFFPFTSASGFALSKCLQTNFLCLQLSHPFSWLPIARVKMQCNAHFLARIAAVIFECWFS